jgi:hypothetical protein
MAALEARARSVAVAGLAARAALVAVPRAETPLILPARQAARAISILAVRVLDPAVMAV